LHHGCTKLGSDAELELVDLFAQVVRNEMTVDLGRDARIAMTHDPLHRERVDAAKSKSDAVVCRKS